ncbi:MAG TPA: nitrate- and nitrite sensing domain-containing protein [Candidatus Sulfotelmatobacter sp.]|jgi:methyl-accepting chemotaxis protein|nr:nitrate- and nitrite sensing domain-containing protein [Candidatus Sulfotelmatobacter sp.]
MLAFRNTRIGKRILMGTAPVAMALLVLGGWMLKAQIDTAEQADSLILQTQLAVSTNAVIHELQKERGASALFLGSKGTQFGSQMADRRRDADARMAELTTLLGGFDASAEAGVGADSVRQVQATLAAFPALRGRIDQQQVPAVEAVGAYSQAVRTLIGVVAHTANTVSDVEAAKLIAAFVALTDAKESAGQERATGSAGFASGKFDAALYKRFIELGAEQKTAFRMFERYASPDALAALKAALSSEIEEPVMKMRQAAIDSPAKGDTGGVAAPDWFAATSKRIDALRTVETRIAQDIAAQAQGQRDQARQSLILLSVCLGGLFLATAVMLPLIVRSIVGPVRRLASDMSRLAEGDLSVGIEGTGFADEVGEMARATLIFKEDSEARRRLESEQALREQEAAQQRQQMLNALADDFEATVRAKVADVGQSVVGITRTASAMATKSEHSGGHSILVAENSRKTTERAEVVSAATHQLSMSINEIAEQIGQTSQIAQQAVADVNRTAQQMDGLERAVQTIGEVVNLINDIASQTNLLALNATIEAARAGEAGKGFAVVANEVKHLANQTAKATDDITRQVGEVQSSTRAMALAIDDVAATIRSLEEVATTIAGAVQEQEASTREISSTISEVALEADGVAKTVVDLSRSTSHSCAGTIRVIWSARTLAKVVEDLNGEVNQFVARVRG